MNRPGGPQPMRAMPGNAFNNQQIPSNTRSTPLGSGRLQNGKLGNTNTWGFGVNPAGATGLNNVQSRTSNSTGLSGFAQAIGGVTSQAHTPLDPSEFPSLSGAPQAQNQSSGAQAIWGGSSGMRTQQNSTGQQRPSNQSQNQSQPPSASTQTIGPPLPQAQRQASEPQSDTHSSQFSPQSASVEDYRFGQDGPANRQSRNQDNQGSADDFPPLGGLGTNGVQSTGSGTYQATQLPYRSNSAADSQQQQGAYGQTHQTHSQQSEQLSRARSDNLSEASTLNEADRWGLPGILETLRGPSRDQASLLLGVDLNDLGLDLHRPENSPLYADWAGPFADPSARPIIPDFNLPPAYTVHNVPPLHSKISSFNDETLFVMFYQNPRDEAQEMAANELYQRDWRWHKKLQQWMMKAKEYGEPVVSPSRQEERGVYYFWDVHNWRRERKEFTLSYEHLHHGQAAPAVSLHSNNMLPM